MSEYYHEFQVSFNYWYVAVPLGLLLMGFLGSRRYELGFGASIKKRGEGFSRLLSIVSVVLGTALMMLINLESAAGLLQLCDNLISVDTDPFWSLIMMGFAEVAIATLLYMLLSGAAKIGECAKLGSLVEERREAKKKKQTAKKLAAP